MSNVINQLLESANPWQSMQSDAQRLSKKWAKSGLLEGLKTEVEKNNMSVILENQAKQLVVEQSQTGPSTATFTPGTGAQYAAVALPLVRKVFGQIAAKEFVSVQPMSLPAGLVFFLDFQYGTNGKQDFAVNQSLYGQASQNFGNYASGGLYGAGRFGYSTNQFSSSIASASVSASSYAVNDASASWADVNWDGTYSASLDGSGNVLGLVKVTIPTSSISSVVDLNGVRAFFAVNTALPVNNALPAYTQVVNNGGSIQFILSGSNSQITSGGNWTVYYNKVTNFQTAGDFEDGNPYAVPNDISSSVIAIPQINVQMRSETISAKTKKLKAQWTPEFAQDLNAYQSIDAEAELTSMLSEYISLEIDLEILDMLIVNAPTVEYWSAKVGAQIAQPGTSFSNYSEGNTNGLFYTQMSWFQTIGIKMQKVSNIIHQRTLRGGANFIVVSPAVATILESIPGFAADTDGAADRMEYAFGVQKVGQLNSRYKVYKNPYMLENQILMGFKGSQFLETGAVYAPYIPLIMTPLVYDPETFTPRKGIMTRYAKKMVRPEFYGKVIVNDLNVI
jgi:hypothetical protein